MTRGRREEERGEGGRGVCKYHTTVGRCVCVCVYALFCVVRLVCCRVSGRSVRMCVCVFGRCVGAVEKLKAQGELRSDQISDTHAHSILLRTVSIVWHVTRVTYRFLPSLCCVLISPFPFSFSFPSLSDRFVEVHLRLQMTQHENGNNHWEPKRNTNKKRDKKGEGEGRHHAKDAPILSTGVRDSVCGQVKCGLVGCPIANPCRVRTVAEWTPHKRSSQDRRTIDHKILPILYLPILFLCLPFILPPPPPPSLFISPKAALGSHAAAAAAAIVVAKLPHEHKHQTIRRGRINMRRHRWSTVRSVVDRRHRQSTRLMHRRISISSMRARGCTKRMKRI